LQMTACRFHLKNGAIVLVVIVVVMVCGVVSEDLHDDTDANSATVTTEQQRIIDAKMDLWSRGAFVFDEYEMHGWQQQELNMAPLRLGPVRQVRRDVSQEHQLHRQKKSSTVRNNKNHDDAWWNSNDWRGGGSVAEEESQVQLQELAKKFGPDFVQAIEQNKRDHAEDCRKSCELFYCAPPGEPTISINTLLQNDTTKIVSYSMGAVPPEDFAREFG
jgi:hypothetical protein